MFTVNELPKPYNKLIIKSSELKHSKTNRVYISLLCLNQLNRKCKMLPEYFTGNLQAYLFDNWVLTRDAKNLFRRFPE